MQDKILLPMAVLEWHLPGGAVRIDRAPVGVITRGEHCIRRPDDPVIFLLL